MTLVVCKDRDCDYCNNNLVGGTWYATGGYWKDRFGRVRHDSSLVSTKFGGTLKDIDNDPIKKPIHYTLPRAASDCFSVMQQIGLLNNHCVATAFQYLWRSGLKQQYISDLKKARWFIDKAIEKYEQEERGRAENK